MDLSVQHRPWCIQIELTFGCQLRCKMCGINSIGMPRRTYHYMSMDLAKKLAKEIRDIWPKIRVEFAMCGEPSQHPKIDRILKTFREYLPDTHLLFTTNGINILKDGWKNWAERLKQCNILVVDCYDPYGDKLEKILRRNPRGWSVVSYYDKEFNQHLNQGGKGHTLVIIPDLIQNAGRKRQRILFNHAGNSALSPIQKTPLNKVCTFPFREIVVRYNGDVNICCLDFGSEYVVGNVKNNTIEKIWFSENFNAVRRYLRHKQRVIAPCIYCDTPSGMRSGILPIYDKPTRKDRQRVIQINKNSPRLNNRDPKFIARKKVGFGL